MLPTLPPAPSRDNPANFASRADALLAALSGWTDAANALEQSLQLVATTGTSTTSLVIGTGSKSLSAPPGKAWVVGAFVYLVSAASITNRMQGQITAYDSSTGALTVNVNAVAGAGTFASWVIGLATPNAQASDVSVADAGGRFATSSVETVLAELFDSIRGASSQIAVASGTANALTASFTPAITTLVDGLIVYVRASLINTGAATFQADATTALSIVKGAGSSLGYGDIAGAGHTLILRLDGTLNKWMLLNPGNGLRGEAPIGMVGYWPGTTPPTGWIKRNGVLLSRTSYPELWAAANASGNIVADGSWSSNPGSFSTGDGSTTFRIPDGRGLIDKGYHDGSGTFTTNTSRSLGSYELDALLAHYHDIRCNSTTGSGTGGGGNFVQDAGVGAMEKTRSIGGSENLVRNAAYLAIIRAY